MSEASSSVTAMAAADPDRIERVQRALERLRALDASCGGGRPIQLNPPLDEAHVREAEARSGITLPDDYRLFLSRIGNGGQIGVIRYMTLDEVLSSNSAPIWSLPLPAEFHDLVVEEYDYINVSGDIDDFRPGLLRISHWSYSQLTVFLTSDGSEYELWVSSSDDPPVCVSACGGWLQRIWVSLEEDLSRIEGGNDALDRAHLDR